MEPVGLLVSKDRWDRNLNGKNARSRVLTSKRELTHRGLRVHRIKHMRRLLHKTILDRRHLRIPLIYSPHLVFTEHIPQDAVLLSPLLPAASSPVFPSLLSISDPLLLGGSNIEVIFSFPPRICPTPDSPNAPTDPGAFYPGSLPQKASLGPTPGLW